MNIRITKPSHVAIIALFAAVFTAGTLTPAATTAAPERNEARGQCYTITGKASYRGFGYKHIVTIKNKCGADIECTVWTSVDPKPKHTVTVAKDSEKSVVTRIGSPSSEFKAEGSCNAPRVDDA